VRTHFIEEIDLRALTDDALSELNAFNNAFRAESAPEDPPTPLDITVANYRNMPDFYSLRDFVVRTGLKPHLDLMNDADEGKLPDPLSLAMRKEIREELDTTRIERGGEEFAALVPGNGGRLK